MSNEADTCRKYVLPKMLAAGWDTDPHSFTEQRTFTDGRIMVEVTNPRLGETVLDPACGTGGFLVETYNHLAAQKKRTWPV